MDARDELLESLELFFERLIGLAEFEGAGFLLETNLSLTQIRTAMLLAYAEPMPISSVADQLRISVHAAGRNIDQLVDLGFVERRESAGDRRVKLVSLTARGTEMIDRHVATRRRTTRAFIDRLPDGEVTAFTEALRPILAGDYLLPAHAPGGSS